MTEDHESYELESQREDASFLAHPEQHQQPTNDWRESGRLQVQILISLFIFLIMGLNDQTLGTLLPTLIEVYATTQTRLSFVFVCQFIGYGLSAVLNDYVHFKIGRLGVLIVSSSCFIASYSVNALGHRWVPLWLFVVTPFVNGVSIGLIDSTLNVWCSLLVDHNEIMGILHGCYGVGSVLAPPLISVILDRFSSRYEIYYMILLGLSVVMLAGVVVFFRDETAAKHAHLVAQSKQDDAHDTDKSFAGLMTNRTILLFSMNLFLYLGAEISIGSWLLTYLKRVQHLGQIDASIVVSFFWVGLTVGRMLIGFVTKYFRNEFRANLAYSVGSLATFAVYVVYSSTQHATVGQHLLLMNKILMFATGFFIGPIFPTSSVFMIKILPVSLHIIGIGIVSCIGCTGSAILPFLVGLVADLSGFTTFPVLVLLIILGYCICWGSIKVFVKRDV